MRIIGIEVFESDSGHDLCERRSQLRTAEGFTRVANKVNGLGLGAITPMLPSEELYTTRGSSPPSGKHPLAAELLTGPMQLITGPMNGLLSKVSTGSPGAAKPNAAAELKIRISA
jgi:hypothetical protein